MIPARRESSLHAVSEPQPEASLLHRVLREPLLHFVLIGAALFGLSVLFGETAPAVSSAPATATIVVTAGDLDQLNRVFTKTWQRPPTPHEEQALIEDFVRNEIYCREAVALGLDRDDAVIRRRLRQKMEFLQEDVASWTEPAEQELRSFMEKHRDKYVSDPRLAFRQVYVDATRRGAGVTREAEEILTRLRAGADADSLGDATMLDAQFAMTSVTEIGRLFGDPFATALLSAPVETWSGPVRSGYGLHLVFVSERSAGELPEWSAIRERVKQDWTVERQRMIKDAAYSKLRARYQIRIEGAGASR